MLFNFHIDSLKFNVVDGFMFSYIVFHYTTPHDKAMFLEKDLNSIDQSIDLDYTIFDNNSSVKIIFILKSVKDFGDLKRLFKPCTVRIC